MQELCQHYLLDKQYLFSGMVCAYARSVPSLEGMGGVARNEAEYM